MRCSPCPLVSALLNVLPHVRLVSRRERDWFSATFSGVRLVMVFESDQPLAEDRLRSQLEAVAELPVAGASRFVADLWLSKCEVSRDGIQLIEIEALLLDE